MSIELARSLEPNMEEQADFTVKVDGNLLVITHPETGNRVAYRKDGRAPILVSTESFRTDPDAERIKFLVAAWKVAQAKAKQLGWLES